MPSQLQPAVPLTEVSDFSEDALLGTQLTAQYRRAVSGMTEVLKFGAMLMQVENTLSNVDKVSARGHQVTGNGIKGGGLKGWLEAHAPEISRPTALRFLGITKAIAVEYQNIVGARVAKRFDLPALVLTDKDELPEEAQIKQLELFDYVAGTSQRSWLDRFKPVESHQTYHPPRRMRTVDEEGEPLPPAELAAQAAREHELVVSRLRQDNGLLMDSLERFTRKKHYQVWNDAELDAAHVYLSEALRAVESWRRMPKGQRLASCVQEEIATWKGLR
jgi:hypothetical protein